MTTRWLILGVVFLVVLLLVLPGPGRLYGLWGARQYEGVVAKIRPCKTDQAKTAETYLVELQTAERQLHAFASSDHQWVMIKQGDYVRVRLYPAPLWRGESGQWQNGRLLGKLVPPERQDEQPIAAGPQSKAAEPPVTPNVRAPTAGGPQAPTAQPPAAQNAPSAKPPATQDAPPPAAGPQTLTVKPPATSITPPAANFQVPTAESTTTPNAPPPATGSLKQIATPPAASNARRRSLARSRQ